MLYVHVFSHVFIVSSSLVSLINTCKLQLITGQTDTATETSCCLDSYCFVMFIKLSRCRILRASPCWEFPFRPSAHARPWAERLVSVTHILRVPPRLTVPHLSCFAVLSAECSHLLRLYVLHMIGWTSLLRNGKYIVFSKCITGGGGGDGHSAKKGEHSVLIQNPCWPVSKKSFSNSHFSIHFWESRRGNIQPRGENALF